MSSTDSADESSYYDGSSDLDSDRPNESAVLDENDDDGNDDGTAAPAAKPGRKESFFVENPTFGVMRPRKEKAAFTAKYIGELRSVIGRPCYYDLASDRKQAAAYYQSVLAPAAVEWLRDGDCGPWLIAFTTTTTTPPLSSTAASSGAVLKPESPASASYQKAVAEAVPDAPSYDALHTLLRGTYRHGDRRVGLWAAIDRCSDGALRCAYTNALIETKEGSRLCKADEEHLVPQSWHRGSREHPGQDMHQIFVTTNEANDSRVNLIFGFNPEDPKPERRVGGTVTRGVFGAASGATASAATADGEGENNNNNDDEKEKDEQQPSAARRGGRQSQRKAATNNMHQGSSSTKALVKGRDGSRMANYFLPHDNLGAVCRATLYTLVTYSDTFLAEFFPAQQLSWLQTNAASIPVTEWERHRNQELERIQGTRNPFVDFPHWALAIDFSTSLRQDSAKQARAEKAERAPRAGGRRREAANKLGAEEDGGRPRRGRGRGRNNNNGDGDGDGVAQ